MKTRTFILVGLSAITAGTLKTGNRYMIAIFGIVLIIASISYILASAREYREKKDEG